MLICFLLSTIVIFALAKAAALSMKVHESRENMPLGFVRSGPAPVDTELQLHIALVQSNPDGLIDALYKVSTPGSASYGRHLRQEEVSIRFVGLNTAH